MVSRLGGKVALLSDLEFERSFEPALLAWEF
jgi:hypothetical protein